MFHLPYAEYTITLQDVAFQLRLHVSGELVNGCTSSWERYHNGQIDTMCDELLGAMPGWRDRQGNSVNFTWLMNTFSNLDNHAPTDVVVCHTQAYILHLLGGSLFGDKLGFRVHLR